MPSRKQRIIDSKYVDTVDVTDPDTGLRCPVEIRKLASGELVGLDGCWLENKDGPARSPYAADVLFTIPDDEE
jgi:hypothetical protein